MDKLRNLSFVVLMGMMLGSSLKTVSAFAPRCLFRSPKSLRALGTRGGSSVSTEETIARDSMGIFDSASIDRKVFAGIPYWDTSRANQFRVFFVLGGPGAGKGTQCELLKDNYPCVHLSVGELLRNVSPESPHAALIQETLVAGNIVPVDISLSLLRTAMEQTQGKSLYYLVDGFPRNFDNLQGWTKIMQTVSSVWGVMNFNCPLEELERRILSRAETSGRSDDNLASARRRFETFERETVPVVNVIRKIESLSKPKLSLRVLDIRGNRPLELVWKDVQCIMNQYILHDVVTANAQLLQAVQDGNAELYKSLVAWDSGEEEEEEKDWMKLMTEYEGASSAIAVSNGLVDFVSGTKVVVSYNRVLADETRFRETRVWSYQGERGWVNIHFSRTPLEL
jgi:UMP-CMP kinase